MMRPEQRRILLQKMRGRKNNSKIFTKKICFIIQCAKRTLTFPTFFCNIEKSVSDRRYNYFIIFIMGGFK